MCQKVPLRKYWMIVGISIATAIGLNNILLVTNIAKYSKSYQEAAQILYSPSFGEQILYIGILIPMIEELIFRGAIFRLLRKKISFTWAMTVSAILFGVYHGNLVQFIYAGLCGVLLAYLYEVYGSIKAPILAHVLMNIAVCTLTEFAGFTWMFEQPLRMAVITVLCAIVGIRMCMIIRNMGKFPKI